jgi:hypothetical protein
VPAYQHVLEKAQDQALLDRKIRVASAEGLTATTRNFEQDKTKA